MYLLRQTVCNKRANSVRTYKCSKCKKCHCEQATKGRPYLILLSLC